jgi:hypothetical protein
MGKGTKQFPRKAVALLAVTVCIVLCEKWRWQRMVEAQAPLRVQLRPAAPLKLPGQVDCNSPAHWDGETLYVFTSAGHPFRSFGRNLFSLGEPQPVRFNNEVNGGRWIESTWRADDGTLYGWYHFEPRDVCPGTTLTAPQIGALRSRDDGATWEDLGIVLKAPDETIDCTAQNGYFAGGHGDFCIVLDERKEWLYFFFGNYGGEVTTQGVCVARMRWQDRDAPVGKVWKWHDGKWEEPGLDGKVTPIFPATVAWQRSDCESFWGPSVHFNTHLKGYVMLLNRAKGQGWKQEGIYISFSTDLSEPKSWSPPQKIYDGGRWYPQVIGLQKGETDKQAGKVARFFMGGISEWEIIFLRSDE